MADETRSAIRKKNASC